MFQINNTIIHPQYNTTNLRNDIAIVKLCTPIQYSDFIQPACLWDEISTKKEDIYYKTATVYTLVLDYVCYNTTYFNF